MDRMRQTETQSLVLSYFSQRLEASARELAGHFAMSRSTLASALSGLKKSGAVVRCGVGSSTGGRPSFRYRLKLPRPLCVCQFEGTQLAGVVFGRDLAAKAERTVPLQPIASVEQAIETVKALLAKLRRAAGLTGKSLGGLALSINAIRSGDRVIVSSVLPWARDGLEERLSAALKMCVKLRSSTSLLAEYQKLAGPLPESLVLFKAGDGVSAHPAFFGREYRGGSNLSGELGHIVAENNGALCGCGKRGCLEAYCSGPAIRARILADLGSGVASGLDREVLQAESTRQTIERLWQAWLHGDNYARSCMDDVLDRLGWGLGLIANLLDPERVVFGGYLFAGKGAWMDEVCRRSQRWILRPADRNTRYELSRVTLEDELRIAAAGFYFGSPP